jgi:membrane-bound lytic murein transglycosylase B
MQTLKKILLFSIIIITAPFLAYADDLATTCAQVSSSDTSCQNLSSADCQALLQQCAAYYDNQSAQIAQDITKTAAQKNTLQNQVTLLKKKISGLEGQIAQGTLIVKDLNLKINDTQNSIDKTTVNIQSSQNQIANILQSVYEEDKKPSFVVLLEGNLSDFFGNLAYLENLNSHVSDLLESTTNLKKYLENQKIKIDTEKGQVQKTIQVQTIQKKQNEQNKQQQDVLLKLTEAQYQEQQKQKADADKKAASIKSRIFDLIGISKAPTFGEAYAIAKYVSSITGVRPAFLLAVLTQESNLGQNVGQCYVTDLTTGNGTNLQGTVQKQRVMNPTSIPGFVNLTQSLGMTPTKTQVSCWIPLYSKGVPYGWGGAMGPAQFIASTWNLYKDRVAGITGKTANPWNINDAFLASGLLLKDNGGVGNESLAAAKYYCGGSATRYECRAYANSVISIANGYADDIAAIGG